MALDARSNSDARRSPGRGVAFVPLAFLALWIVLRVLPYSGRAQLYAGVSRVLEAYRSPVWAGVACVIAMVLLVRAARGRTRLGRGSDHASDVHVREESDGRLAVLLPGERGAMARDFIVNRDPTEERAILDGLAALAERSQAFGARPSREAVAEAHREVHALGLSLCDALLGKDRELRERLFDLPGEHLLLRIQPSLAGLPWELLVPRPGAQYLWQQFHVARQIRDGRGVSPGRDRGAGPMRVLLLANLEAGLPGRDLQAAEAEAQELMELSALDPERLRVTRRSPRSADELRRALAEGYDVVHFAGHTRSADGRDGWVMANGQAVDPGDAVEASGTPPLLVFANACSSGPGASRSEGAGAAPMKLMSAGAAAYLGTLWELEDAGAAGLARVFYRNLVAGRTLGESLTAARASRLGVSPFTWANYVLYGDPTVRLQDPR